MKVEPRVMPSFESDLLKFQVRFFASVQMSNCIKQHQVHKKDPFLVHTASLIKDLQ